MTQVSIALGDFVTLRLIRGCALGPLEASALGGKTGGRSIVLRPIGRTAQ